MSVSVDLARLRKLGEDCRLLDFQLVQLRGLRDKVALDLVEAGVTWRDVAEAAGFKNPYIAQLQARREADSRAPDEASDREEAALGALRGAANSQE